MSDFTSPNSPDMNPRMCCIWGARFPGVLGLIVSSGVKFVFSILFKLINILDILLFVFVILNLFVSFTAIKHKRMNRQYRPYY